MDLKQLLSDTWSDLLPKVRGFFSALAARILELKERFSDLGPWKYFVIPLCIVLVWVFLPDGSPPPPPVTVEPPVQPPFFETKAFQRIALFAAAALLLLTVITFVYDVGKIHLSAQTIGHRRNVLLALSIIILAEVFQINIAQMLSLNVNDQTNVSEGVLPQTLMNPESINTYAFGVLGFFCVYSFIEYAFTFISDYLRSRSEWKKNGSNSGGAGAAVFVIGVYRSIFDILLPSVAFLFVVVHYWPQTEIFVDRMANELICGRAKLADTPEIYRSKILNSLDDIEKMCPKCSYATTDLRDSFGVVDEYTRSKFSWKALECKPDG